jgi:hypothetical protein
MHKQTNATCDWLDQVSPLQSPPPGFVEELALRMEGNYRRIDTLIGEIQFLVDLLFVNHKVPLPGDSA